MTPIPAVWGLRPVRSAARVGAQRAVVWKRLYFSPPAASRSAVGVAHSPPNALEAAKPTSSRRMTSTFGAPAGGRSGSIGGKLVSGSLASNVTGPVNGRSGIGRTSRWLGAVPNSFSTLGIRDLLREFARAPAGPTSAEHRYGLSRLALPRGGLADRCHADKRETECVDRVEETLQRGIVLDHTDDLRRALACLEPHLGEGRRVSGAAELAFDDDPVGARLHRVTLAR